MIIETLERLSAPTPKYFKKLIKLSLSVGAVGAGIMAAPAGVVIPAMLVKAAGYMVTAGVIGASIGKLTVDDAAVGGSQNQQPDPTSESHV